jgi:hypothetical protein
MQIDSLHHIDLYFMYDIMWYSKLVQIGRLEVFYNIYTSNSGVSSLCEKDV